MTPALNVAIAISGGLIPILLWLWFWLREDRENPEPKKALFLSFIAGAAAVALSIPLENMASAISGTGVAAIISISAIEEITKLLACFGFALYSKENDEPIDSVVYLVVTALGFAAVENMLFFFNEMKESGLIIGAMNLNLRFMGATLLHTITSGTVGMFLALSFRSSEGKRAVWGAIGLLTAIALHAAFNFSIISNEGKHTLTVFSIVWAAIVLMLLVLEKIKRLRLTAKLKR